MKYLGIDFGEKKIGLSLSDQSGRFAFPYGTILNKDSLNKIQEIIKNNEVGAIIIGKSIDLDLTENKIFDQTKKFSEDISLFFSGPIHFIDERYSTSLANNDLLSRNRPLVANKRKNQSEIYQKNSDDAAAAALILQSYLDKNNN